LADSRVNMFLENTFSKNKQTNKPWFHVYSCHVFLLLFMNYNKQKNNQVYSLVVSCLFFFLFLFLSYYIFGWWNFTNGGFKITMKRKAESRFHQPYFVSYNSRDPDPTHKKHNHTCTVHSISKNVCLRFSLSIFFIWLKKKKKTVS